MPESYIRDLLVIILYMPASKGVIFIMKKSHIYDTRRFFLPDREHDTRTMISSTSAPVETWKFLSLNQTLGIHQKSRICKWTTVPYKILCSGLNGTIKISMHGNYLITKIRKNFKLLLEGSLHL